MILSSIRVKEWDEFALKVRNHLEFYTVPQYGDKGADCITNYSIQECLGHIDKYSKRYGRQSRKGQQELDFLKMAHYVQCASEKYDRKMDDVNNSRPNVYTEIFTGETPYPTIEQLKNYIYEEMSGVKVKNIKITVEVTE